MPYREIVFSSGNYYHVFCRGNEKRDIFLDSADYEYFLSKAREYRLMHKISVVSYCLMPNHFHLLLEQNTENTISSFMHRLTVSYSMYFNKRYKRSGHLFQGSFKAKIILTEDYLLHLSRYIHLNPVDIIKSVSKLEAYPWSSYCEYIRSDIGKGGICEKEIVLQQFGNLSPQYEYKKFVKNYMPDSEFVKIKSLLIEDE